MPPLSQASLLGSPNEANCTIARPAYLPGNKTRAASTSGKNSGNCGNASCSLPTPNSSAHSGKRHRTGKNSGNISGKNGKTNTSRQGHTRDIHPDRGKNGKTGNGPKTTNPSSLISRKNGTPTAAHPPGNISNNTIHPPRRYTLARS
ncbi:MAG: hypothetical protein ACXWQ8_05610 [Ktedonobacterales bacterium]